MVLAKYIAICIEDISGGVWHLCGFVIYHAWEELSVVQYRIFVDEFTCTFWIMLIVKENVQPSYPLLAYVSFYKNVLKKGNYLYLVRESNLVYIIACILEDFVISVHFLLYSLPTFNPFSESNK